MSLIGAAWISGGAALAGGAIDWWNQKKDREAQADENAIIREREDTAVQRRAADMDAAGMNRVLAAGAPAQTGITSAPKLDYKTNVSEKMMMAKNIAMTNAQIKAIQAGTNKTDAEAEVIKGRSKADVEYGDLRNNLARLELKKGDIDLITKEQQKLEAKYNVSTQTIRKAILEATRIVTEEKGMFDRQDRIRYEDMGTARGFDKYQGTASKIIIETKKLLKIEEEEQKKTEERKRILEQSSRSNTYQRNSARIGNTWEGHGR